jgi:hypothetical protein
MMQKITLKAHTNQEGWVRLDVPTELPDSDVEIVIVVRLKRPTSDPTDTTEYSISYFEDTYGSFKDDPLERNQPILPDQRDEII